jgi:cytochrome P450
MYHHRMTTSTNPTPTQTPAQCPVDHAALGDRKTSREPVRSSPPLERDAAGVWQVRGFHEVRAVLRSDATRQAGFGADQIAKMPATMREPVLHMEGQTHHELRTKTARFFTPATTDKQYRALMERLSDDLIATFQRQGRADLSELSMRLAVSVAAQIVGLTNPRWPGMSKRIERMVQTDLDPTPSTFQRWARLLTSQANLLAFWVLDVQPAINARRKQPREDVISHVLSEGYSSPEILSECVTYGAAGMVTTREFISVAAWHLLEQPRLKARYLIASEAERHAILGEILRLEPVVGTLKRRAINDLSVESDEQTITIPAGALIELHVYGANADETTVGACPHQLQPDRSLPRNVQPSVMSFGDGHHRCPGSFVALQESDVFLRKLLALPKLRIERAPDLGWNANVKGYELRNFILSIVSEGS